MIDFLRRFSQANRVTYSFFIFTVLLIGSNVANWLHISSLLPHLPPDIAATTSEHALLVIAIISIVSVTSIIFSLIVRHSIIAPVEDTVESVTRIANGDLETKISSPGRDELSWLRHELNLMRKKLRGMALDVRVSVHNVSAASHEIAQGNTDLASRTENQASALEQATLTMQKLADCVSEHADSARDANDEMLQASNVASRGGKYMHDVVAQMQEINDSSGQISEIIKVIDSIAFQTNILALNAAVEAARAGEHGRGFAVVASAVRELALRITTAASEINALIAQSTERVASGSKLVDEAGETMRELLERVSKASKLVEKMAGASEYQRVSIESANKAITLIDEAVKQNSKLVVEVAATAQGLRKQSQILTETISIFHLSSESDQAPEKTKRSRQKNTRIKQNSVNPPVVPPSLAVSDSL